MLARTAWIAGFALAAACASAPTPPPTASAPESFPMQQPPDPPPPRAAEPQPDRAGLQCEEFAPEPRYTCFADRVTPEVKRHLEAYPRGRHNVHLWLREPTQADFETVASIPWILQLHVFKGEHVTSLEPLRTLPHLQRFSIHGAPQVTDLSPAGDCHQLREIEIFEGNIKDLTPISKLSLINILRMNGNPVESLAPFAGRTTLFKLDISRTKVHDVAPVATMTGLTELRAEELGITDIGFMAPLSKIDHADIGRNPITSLAPLAGAADLTMLHASDTCVSDIRMIAKLPKIWLVNVERTRVTDVAPFAATSSIHALFVSDTMPGLEKLRRAKPDLKLETESKKAPSMFATPWRPALDPPHCR